MLPCRLSLWGCRCCIQSLSMHALGPCLSPHPLPISCTRLPAVVPLMLWCLSRRVETPPPPHNNNNASCFYLKTHQSQGGRKAHLRKWAGNRPLKTKRLKEYTLKCHSSMPPNNTYVNFERFARVVDDLSGMEQSFATMAASHDSLQEDLDALVSIYNEKEAWYKEEHENVRRQLSQLKYESRKVESFKKNLQEDVRAVGASLAGVTGKYLGLQSQYEALSKEVSAELQRLQDWAGALQLDPGPYSLGGFGSACNKDLSESLMELLNRSCCEEFLAALNLGVAKASQ